MDYGKLHPADWTLIGQASLVTIVLCIGAMLGGMLIAALANAPAIWRSLRWLRPLVVVYVEFFRSTPLLIQLIAIYFALPLMGVQVPAVLAASVALVLYSGAYLTEIFRAGLQSVHRGQWEASLSLGMSRLQAIHHVIFVQAARVALPSIVSFAVLLVKGSSVVSIIGFVELTRAGRQVVDWTREAFAVWLLVAAIYFLICYPLSLISKQLEKRLAHGSRSAL